MNFFHCCERYEYYSLVCRPAHPRNEKQPAVAMTQMGLSSVIQATILSSAFQEVRETEPITFWALDTITVSWKTLLRLDSRLKAAAVRTRAKKKAKIHVGAVFF